MDIFSCIGPKFFCEGGSVLASCSSWKAFEGRFGDQQLNTPSYARAKVEVDLLRDFPQIITVGVRKQTSEVVEKCVRIKYDHLPKYCKSCKIQGHDEEQYYVLHPELYLRKEKEEDKSSDDKKKEKDNKQTP